MKFIHEDYDYLFGCVEIFSLWSQIKKSRFKSYQTVVNWGEWWGNYFVLSDIVRVFSNTKLGYFRLQNFSVLLSITVTHSLMMGCVPRNALLGDCVLHGPRQQSPLHTQALWRSPSLLSCTPLQDVSVENDGIKSSTERMMQQTQWTQDVWGCCQHSAAQHSIAYCFTVKFFMNRKSTL